MLKLKTKRMMAQTTKTHQNLGLVVSLALGSLILGLVGCGSPSSDPTSAYKGLGATVKPHNLVARDQSVLETGAYTIDQEKDATVIEGQAQSFKVTVRTFQKVDSYDLSLVKVPGDVSGISLSKVDGEEGVFQINWTAPKGTVPVASPSRSVPYRLEISNVKSSDPSTVTLFNSVTRTKDFEFKVVRTGTRPEITKDIEVPKEVVQGSVVPFTVEVMDPASHDGLVPRLDIYFQGTNKTEGGYEANGATYVRVEKAPKHLGGGLWSFSFVFDAKNNDVGAQLDREGKRVDGATHLNARMLMKAYSASGGVSNERPVVLKIKYAQPQLGVIQTQVCPAPVKPVVKPAAKITSTTKPAVAKK